MSTVGDIMSTVEGYHDKYREDVLSTVGMFSTMRDIMSTGGLS